MFSSIEERAVVANECAKRNKHISRFHPCRWIALWDQSKGWHPELRPIRKEVAA